jgi:peptidoglycan/LPS O-acetylase OafA/YrhL
MMEGTAGIATQSALDRRIPALDGLRAIAILSVMACHLFGYSMLNKQWPFLPRIIAAITAPGWLGVDLFFVLSGFLISSILLSKRFSADYYRPFYVRRFWRIVPLYFVILTIVTALFHGRLVFYLACLLFGANLCPLLGVVAPPPATVFWSLAVEEHFYALWPIAVRRLGQRALPAIAGSIFIVEPILRYVCARRGIETYQYSWFRFDGLAIGALLAIYLNSGRRDVAVSRALILSGALLFLCGCLFLVLAGGMKEPSPFATLRPSISQIGFATVMLAALEFPGGWSAFLGTRPLRITADLSYCLYLIHQTIAALYDRVFSHDDFSGVLTRAGAVLVASYAIAWLSFRYFESPLLALSRAKPAPSPVLVTTEAQMERSVRPRAQ